MFFKTSRWIIFLIISYLIAFFIHPLALILLQYITIISYISGRLVTKFKRKGVFLTTIILLLVPLAVIRTSFFSTPPSLSLYATLGVSFYSLKALSYVIDNYKSKISPEKNYGIYSLYIAFFPQLLSGPIDRPKNLIPQLKNPRPLSIERTHQGSVRIMWGLFEKIAVANSLGLIVDAVYKEPRLFIGLPLLLAILLYAIQIYCDFSGYSHIAIGVAHILGIESTENFNKPYHANSFQDFWRRWHISLSSWLRDYIYIPLGGNRVGLNRQFLNIIITFLVSGVWHGRGIAYIIWGLFHGLGIVSNHVIEIIKKEAETDRDWHALITYITKYLRWLSVPITFLLISLLWVFFRAYNLDDAAYVLTHFYPGLRIELSLLLSGKLTDLWQLIYQSSYQIEESLFISILLVIPLYGLLSYLARDIQTQRLSTSSIMVRWTFYYSVICSILIFLYFIDQSKTTFIYSRF